MMYKAPQSLTQLKKRKWSRGAVLTTPQVMFARVEAPTMHLVTSGAAVAPMTPRVISAAAVVPTMRRAIFVAKTAALTADNRNFRAPPPASCVAQDIAQVFTPRPAIKTRAGVFLKNV